MAKKKSLKTNTIIYQAKSGAIELRGDFDKETIWATQDQIANLFSTTKQNISQHLKSIFLAQELSQKSVVKDFFTTAKDGKQYNVITSAGPGVRIGRKLGLIIYHVLLLTYEHLQLVSNTNKTFMGTTIVGIWAGVDGAIHHYRRFIRYSILQSIHKRNSVDCGTAIFSQPHF